MPLILPGNVASALGGAYSIDNSCRMTRGSSTKFERTISSDGSLVAWTYNVWLKRGSVKASESMGLLWNRDSSGTAAITSLEFDNDNILYFYNYDNPGDGEKRLKTSRVFRDPSAWYNLHIIWDSNNGTAGDRMRIFINGTEETAFGTDQNPGSGAEGGLLRGSVGTKLSIGFHPYNNSMYFDGYMAQSILCDGQVYLPTKFGEFNEDSPRIWQPIDPSEQSLTFGTHGWWLDFKDSSALGNDVSGNNNDFTPANLDATDQSIDTPTNSFATGNPLNWGTSWSGSLSNGNNTLAGSSSTNTYNTLFSTIAVNKGKWYAEFKITSSSMELLLGVSTPEAAQLSAQTNKISSSSYITTGHGYGLALSDGIVYFQNNSSTGQTDISGDGSQNDIIGIYLDLDNNKLYYAVNGSVCNSGTGISITNDYYHFHAGDGSQGGAAGGDMNFGANGSFGDTAVSSAVADKNGYGAFEYNPSSGTFDGASKDFLALCTKNLATDG